MTYPIVLAHGLCRFDTLWRSPQEVDNTDDPRRDKRHYFKGIRGMLQRRGHTVFHSNVAWAAPVDRRADDLRGNVARVLAATGASKVNLIANSMGGLDARHMLFNDRLSGRIHLRVASLTTLSTPHWGSPFADWGLDHLPGLIPAAARMGLDIRALRDLRTDACRRYNRCAKVQVFEQTVKSAIRFQTYAGRQGFWAMCTPLKLPYAVIRRREGANDGLVSVRSARWQPEFFKGVIEHSDHLNLLGWWEPAQLLAGESPSQLRRRVHAFFADLAARLP